MSAKSKNKSESSKVLTDEQIIKKHDPACRGRAYIELQIVNRLIETAAKHGYTLRVFMDDIDNNEYENGPYDVKSAIFDLDDAWISVEPAGSDKLIGWIRLVMGNDGYDVISDYSTNLETFLKPIDEVARYWGD